MLHHRTIPRYLPDGMDVDDLSDDEVGRIFDAAVEQTWKSVPAGRDAQTGRPVRFRASGAPPKVRKGD